MGFLDELFGIEAPPPAPTFDAGKSAQEYTRAMADPDLQEALLGAETTYRPRYQDIKQMLRARAVDPTSDVFARLAGRGYETARGLTERQATDDVRMLQRMGPQYAAAARAADPFMQARVEQANLMADQAYEDTQLQDLSPEMRRRADQSNAEAFFARGRGEDNAAIASQAMGREDYLRQIRNQNRQVAQGLGGYAANLNRATAPDVFSTILDRNPAALQRAAGQQGIVYGSAALTNPSFINPDAGVNLGMADASRLGEYGANVYGANTAAKAGLGAGFMSMMGSGMRAAAPGGGGGGGGGG